VGNPFIGEIRIAGFNFAPNGWSLANGQLLAVSQNSALFNLIGTTYGGDDVNTFALPNIQSRMPMHMGAATGLSQRLLSQVGGQENTTFMSATIPSAPQAPISALAPTGPTLASVSPFGSTLSSLCSGFFRVRTELACKGGVLPVRRASIEGGLGRNRKNR
jgi:microcystin-dependent protein